VTEKMRNNCFSKYKQKGENHLKKIMFGLCAVTSLLIFSSVSIAVEKMEINAAFKKGLISITIIGKARGEMAELRLKRLSATPIIILINNGRTDIAGEVSILSEKDAEIDLSSKYEGAVYVKQTGANRVTGGPITLNPGSGI
jgi:hypothetical protein